MRKLYDISPLISARLAVFPGDQSFRRNVAMDFLNGNHLTLSSIETSVHIGSHADGPNHYDQKGVGIDQVSPARYMGPCVVLHANTAAGERVRKQHFSSEYNSLVRPNTRRILVRTGSFPDPEKWNSDFCSLDPDLIQEWASFGVRLVGIDTPSIDPETSKQLESHSVVALNRLSILEGLILNDVPEGIYTLIALPLKIEDGDAAPVRAILINDAGLDLEFDK